MGIATNGPYRAGILGLVDVDFNETLLFESLEIVLYLAFANPEPLGEVFILGDAAKLPVQRIDLHEDQAFVTRELRSQPDFLGDVDAFKVALLTEISGGHADIIHEATTCPVELSPGHLVIAVSQIDAALRHWRGRPQ